MQTINSSKADGNKWYTRRLLGDNPLWIMITRCQGSGIEGHKTNQVCVQVWRPVLITEMLMNKSRWSRRVTVTRKAFGRIKERLKFKLEAPLSTVKEKKWLRSKATKYCTSPQCNALHAFNFTTVLWTWTPKLLFRQMNVIYWQYQLSTFVHLFTLINKRLFFIVILLCDVI